MKNVISKFTENDRKKLAEALEEMDALVKSYKFTSDSVIVNGRTFYKVSDLDDWIMMQS